MRMISNTILITGGTSGIGRGLAEAFHKLGNQVIITGRREDRLKSICAANLGMKHYVLDVANAGSVREVARKTIEQFPALNCVFNNAGIQSMHDFSVGMPLDEQAVIGEINTNLMGTVRVAAEFIPHLKKQQNATLVNVSSGLAFTPLARFPVYCATKAAVHSFTLSLRHQLKQSGIKVIELIPPYVATELGGPSKQIPPGAPQPMPLDTFIAETMKELTGDADEVAIGDAKHLMSGSNADAMKKIFAGMNR